MKHKAFFDHHHAVGYLKDSIIRVDGDPIYIQDVAARRRKKPDNYDLIYSKIGAGPAAAPHTISIQDDAVDMNPIPLGFCNFSRNYNDFATVVMRAPMRMWKVGLTTRNAALKAPHREYDGLIGVNQLLFSKSFVDMVKNNYPSLKEIARQFNNKDRQGSAYLIAFSRNFAVDNKKLYYRSFGEVGFFKNGEVRLAPEHNYLQELLDKDMKR